VGILRDAITITTDPLPSISRVERGFFDSGGANNNNFTIFGENFDANASVAVFCDGDQWRTVNAADVTGPVSSSEIRGINFDPVLATLGADIGCLIRVTNVNNASAIYSALPRKNGQSRNLAGAWTLNTPLRMPRRDHAMVLGQLNSVSKYFYIIGGDNKTSTFSSIEYTQVAFDASLSPFQAMPADLELPMPLTSVRATVIKNFIYIAGGLNSTGGAVDVAMRAEILSDQARPDATINVDLVNTGEPNNTFTHGLWYWAVSAVFPSNHPTNPDGESLPSFVQPVSLPDIPELPLLKLIVGWDPVPGASGYRVYRAGPNESVAMLRPVADVSGGTTQAYTDRGGAAIAGRGPLPLGAIGKWDTRLPRLNQARGRSAITSVASQADGSKTWIYVFGGHNGTFLNSVERLEVDGSAAQVWSSTWALSTNLPVGRSDHGVWVHNLLSTPAYTGNATFIAIGGGTQNGGAINDNSILQGQVTVSGNIAFVDSGAPQNSAAVAYCAFTSTEISYWTGGHGTGNLVGNAATAKFILTGTPLDIPPAMPGQTNTGTSLLATRSAMGCGSVNAHLFVSGGQSAGDATGVVYYSVEYVLF